MIVHQAFWCLIHSFLCWLIGPWCSPWFWCQWLLHIQPSGTSSRWWFFIFVFHPCLGKKHPFWVILVFLWQSRSIISRSEVRLLSEKLSQVMTWTNHHYQFIHLCRYSNGEKNNFQYYHLQLLTLGSLKSHPLFYVTFAFFTPEFSVPLHLLVAWGFTENLMASQPTPLTSPSPEIWTS